MARKDKDSHNEYQREYYNSHPEQRKKQRARVLANNTARRKNGRELLNTLKSVPCVDCGGKFPPVCMHFDHVPERGEKIFNVGNGYSTQRSDKAILEEI